MTNSKKLILMLPLIFGMHFGAQAQDSLASEVNSILVFAQTLREENSTETNKIAEWLVQKTASNSQTSLIKNLADILSNSELTTESKIIVISQEIQQETAEQKRQEFNKICKYVGGTILSAGLIAALVLFCETQLGHTVVSISEKKLTSNPIFSFVEKKGYWPFSYTTTQSWHIFE